VTTVKKKYTGVVNYVRRTETDECFFIVKKKKIETELFTIWQHLRSP